MRLYIWKYQTDSNDNHHCYLFQIYIQSPCSRTWKELKAISKVAISWWLHSFINILKIIKSYTSNGWIVWYVYCISIKPFYTHTHKYIHTCDVHMSMYLHMHISTDILFYIYKLYKCWVNQKQFQCPLSMLMRRRI